MPTQIKTWQVVKGKLQPVDTQMSDAGRKEAHDLEEWIASNPSIVSPDIVVIGRQTMTKSGPLDLLAIDKQGNVVIVELKRDALPREALVQAIDYASDVAEWGVEILSEICTKYTGKSLEEQLIENFPDIDLENIAINEVQRIFLVGFGIEGSLERMVNWLSSNYGVSINAILLKYIKTSGGDELLTRTAVISEAVEQIRTEKKKKFKIPMTDVAGNYPLDELAKRLKQYLSQSMWSAQRMQRVLFPVLLRDGKVNRDQLKEELVKFGEAENTRDAGYFLSLISSQMGMVKNDFIRQVIGYEPHPDYPWIKETYFIREEYKDLVSDVIKELSAKSKNA
ncbi:MAG: endonuclease NucS domain-containing protein [Chloroflexota bacterium]